MHNDRWQENCTHWQSRFIHHNSLTLGYLAWNGYLRHQRGLLTCDVINPILYSIDWQFNSVAFNPFFVAQARVAKYLQELELEQSAIDVVTSAIVTYNPTEAIVLLIRRNQEVEINLLQNLAISPPHCYQQVQRRWAEFQPSLT
ncbi:hypothetical protein ACQ4M3_17030 [Leptolyngbya sp. AN03gr2]|uniref:hypothetical protein n=1 Tax=unclassified Leptolyngbya TaxID=2650499 RepID=UPI003D316B28